MDKSDNAKLTNKSNKAKAIDKSGNAKMTNKSNKGKIMRNKKENILYTELEIPDIVWEKADAAFSQIAQEETARRKAAKKRQGTPSAKNTSNRRKHFHLPKAAAAAIICCLIFGTTVTATKFYSLYRQRMENMEKQEIDELYELANVGETNELNRKYTTEESARYQSLSAEYEQNGLFPDKSMTIMPDASYYDGEGVAFDSSTSTIYLPAETLSDEELLEIIDFNHKMAYSIYETNQERILSEGSYESRLAAMTDEDVDRIYLAYCASNLELGGGYSRELNQSETKRYEELKAQYENEGVYAEDEISIIKTVAEYSGSGVVFCEENSKFLLPDEELSDLEFLQIIDFDHKIDYCFSRIHDEIMLGLRDGYPQVIQP